MKFLTDAEVAEVLRCSKMTVGRLRRSGQLPYLPGRPALIDEKDFNAYLERRKIPAVQSDKEPPAKPKPAGGRRQQSDNEIRMRARLAAQKLKDR